MSLAFTCSLYLVAPSPVYRLILVCRPIVMYRLILVYRHPSYVHVYCPQVKALAICHVLEEKMREFRDSIPLFADLKNDALRDRWGHGRK